MTRSRRPPDARPDPAPDPAPDPDPAPALAADLAAALRRHPGHGGPYFPLDVGHAVRTLALLWAPSLLDRTDGADEVSGRP